MTTFTLKDWESLARGAAVRQGIPLPPEAPDAPWTTGASYQPGFDDLRIKAEERITYKDPYRAPLLWYAGVLDDWEPESLAAKPAPSLRQFFLGLIVGLALGGDFVWIAAQLLNAG